MKLIKYCFNKRAFKSALTVEFKIFIAVFLFFAIANGIAFSLNSAALLNSNNYFPTSPTEFYEENLLQLIGLPINIIAAITAIIMASVQFSYLMFKKSTISVHSLPQSRAQLFTAKYFMGCGVFVVGLVVFITIYSLFLIAGFSLQAFLTNIYFVFHVLCIFMLYYALACFLHILSGIIFVAPLLFASIVALPILFAFVLYEMFETFLPMFSYNVDSFMGNIANGGLFANFTAVYSSFSDIQAADILINVATIVISLLIYTFGIYSYNKRKSENTGQFIVFSAARQIITVVLSLFWGAVFAISIVYTVYSNTNFENKIYYSALTLTLTAVFTVLAYHITLFILCTFSFKNFSKKAALQSVLSSAVLITFIVILQNGGLGYTTYIPKADDVEYFAVNTNYHTQGVTLSALHLNGTALTEDENPELLFAQDAQKNEIILFHSTYLENEQYMNLDAKDIKNYSFATLTYKLKNGETVSREFLLPYSEEIINTENSSQNILNNLAAQSITLKAVEQALNNSNYSINIISSVEQNGDFHETGNMHFDSGKVPDNFFETVFEEIKEHSEQEVLFTSYAQNFNTDEIIIQSPGSVQNAADRYTVYVYANSDYLSFSLMIEIEENMQKSAELIAQMLGQ